MTTITLNKGGTGETTIESSAIQIPDLWHIAEYLKEHKVKFGDGRCAGEDVLKAWNLAHNLKNHIQRQS